LDIIKFRNSPIIPTAGKYLSARFVSFSRWDEIRFVSSNLLELPLVHLEERIFCEVDTEFFTGLLQGGVEKRKTAVVHGRKQMMQVMVTEVGECGKQGAVDGRPLSYRIQLSQAPIPVNSERME
jgi:hypothetical protein